MNVRVLLTVVGLGTAAWTDANAQATGIWLAGTQAYQGALSQTRLSSFTLFGGALGRRDGGSCRCGLPRFSPGT